MRVLIADRLPAFRRDLAHYLTLLDSGCEVVGMVGTAAETLAHCAAGAPDVVVVDVDLPDVRGLALVRRVKAAWPDVAVLVIGNYPAIEYRQIALALGASAYTDKLDLASELPAELHQLAGAARRPRAGDRPRSVVSPAG